jgi:Cu2+-exporting ATPase
MASCLHCELEVPADSRGGDAFCCPGCRAAYAVIGELGLGRYYQRRRLDPAAAALRPDEEGPPADYAAHVTPGEDGVQVLHLMVEGLQCAACVWLIESVLRRQPGVVAARLNMTTRRLVLTWRGAAGDAEALAGSVNALGYRLVPYDPAVLGAESTRDERELLRALAVAGFAAGNVMLLSVSVWAGHAQGMGPATRDLLHWVSALIALPAIAYAGVPFYRSALRALRAGHVNMDVPISLAVILTAAMSLYETASGGLHTYFDSAVWLLFFLLIGRYLDRRARGRARQGAEHLLALGARAVTVVTPGGGRHLLAPTKVRPGMAVAVAAGERIAVDGIVSDGASDIDSALISGETVPVTAGPGDRVFAGTVNLSNPLVIETGAVGEDTLLGEIVRLMEAAEQGRARYVAVADRVARVYAPAVHGLAAAAFLGWLLIGGAGWQQALLIAVSVLIVTCPCALALAVPVVQVVASGRLLRQGILVKSGTALERLARADWVAFDKTGTLTGGRPELLDAGTIDPGDLALAASLAGASTHPLARALSRARPDAGVAAGVRETPGCGLAAETPDGEVRLGSRSWCGAGDGGGNHDDGGGGPELWLARPGKAPLRFAFADSPRRDAAAVVADLKARGLGLTLLSGDRPVTVAAVADAVGIDDRHGALPPAEKCRRLAALAEEGHRVLMVGDGLNDAPALAAAYVSLSPSSAADVSQTAADVLFQGARLAPVTEAITVAGRADSLVRQNFALAFLYNGITVPLAMAGLVTPLVAAVAMSASSLVVIVNALRLGRP